MEQEIWQKITEVTALVSEDSFSEKLYELLLQAADITHYGIFIFDVNRIVDPELVFYGGRISDYWMKVYALNDRHATLNKNIIFDKNLRRISTGKMNENEFYRFAPNMGIQSEIQKIYKDSGTCEKFYLLHFAGEKLFQFNVYRSEQRGLFSVKETKRLEEILPFLNSLVKLRIQICGADEYQRRSRKSAISNLKKRNVPLFKSLSRRETQVCDLIIFGLTTEGISAELGLSVSSIKTFRNRAYKKLNITSKSELFTMILNSK